MDSLPRSTRRATGLIAVILLLLGGCAAPLEETPEVGAEGASVPAFEGLAVIDARGQSLPSSGVPLTVAGAGAMERRAPGPTLSLAFLPPGAEVLPARAAPTEHAPVIGELDGFILDIPSTGAVATTGGVEWVEVLVRGAGFGWVPRQYTSEWVPSEDFCTGGELADQMLGEFAAALFERSENRVAALLSPTHGLRVRYVRDAEVHFEGTSAAVDMHTVQPIEWAFEDVSGTALTGSFDELVGRELAATISSGETTCNRLVVGNASYDVVVPEGQVNLNFYSVHVPAMDEGGTDWVTWTVGITYLDGVPYIAALNRYAFED